MSLLPFPDTWLLPAAVIAVLGILVLVVVLRIRRRSVPARTAAPGPTPGRKFAYQPESKTVLHIPAARKSVPVRKEPEPPVARQIDLVSGKRDLSDSLAALATKYSLDSVTLATCDGLVIASTSPDGAEIDAARFAEIYVSSPLFETPGAVIIGIAHEGSDIIGIIRANNEISDEICGNIESDTKVILNSWI
ncbi:hypothetical protein [Methanoregula sp.]|uniref:hypothetical protein n=1 Tax=Methanoregula sp. TaxID=2052170 RepID=UPI003563A830